MGLVCSKLFCLFCCPPYLPKIVSKVAFSPPPCTYSIFFDESKNSDRLEITNADLQVLKEYEKYVNIYTINFVKNHKFAKPPEISSLSCLYLKTAPWSKRTILFNHGNAVDIGMITQSLIEFGLELKVNIVTYDYSGYGLSTGCPSERNLYEDVVAVLEFMTESLDISHGNVLLYGQSIGSVPAMFLATKFRFPVLILHSPLASGFRFLQCCQMCASLFQCCDVLDNIKRAKHIKCPVLLIHGVDDEITPVEHSYALFKHISMEFLLEPLFIDGAEHNNCEIFPSFMRRLQNLIEVELDPFQPHLVDSICSK